MYPYIEQIISVMGAKETTEDIRDTHQMMEVIRVTLSQQLLDLGKNLSKKNNVSFDAKWNKVYLIEISNVARLHALYISAKSFKEGIETLKVNEKTTKALGLL